MSEFCDIHCPFLGCASCEFSGGVDPSAGTVFAGQRGKMRVRKTAPAGNRGLTSKTVRSPNGCQ